MTGQGILAAGVTIGGFKWTGNFTAIDLIAATTNALNGALLARRPDHYKNFTIVGILPMPPSNAISRIPTMVKFL